MTNTALQTWLDRHDDELKNALETEIREHISTLQAQGEKFYGYAILPGEPYNIRNLVAVFNRESDIPTESFDDDCGEAYYRYGVNEWQNYEYDKFPISNQLIAARNATFEALHVKEDPDNLYMDDFQVAHIDKLLATLLQAMTDLRHQGSLGDDNTFCVIWFFDASHEIMQASAKALNMPPVYEAYNAEFGE